MGSVAQFLRLLYKSPSSLTALQILDATGGLILKLTLITLFSSYSFASESQGEGRGHCTTRLQRGGCDSTVLFFEMYNKTNSFSPDFCASLDPTTQCESHLGQSNFQSFGCSWLVVFQVSAGECREGWVK
jgi:hypothetical protein